MSAAEFHLYRVKFISPAQRSIFPDISPQLLFQQSIGDRPSVELRKNHVWHIGNIEHVDDVGGRFAVGRTTKTTVEKFDDKTGNFLVELDDAGPYTLVYFDLRIGLLAIARKAKVAPDVRSIASKLQRLFSQSSGVVESGVHVKVQPILDPDPFLTKIRDAYAVKRFRADFTGPNPIDADALFQRPLSYYCQALDGDHGSVVLNGASLNKENVVAVAKSTAATGNAASAVIQPGPGERGQTISFAGDAVKVVLELDVERSKVLETIRASYAEVRE